MDNALKICKAWATATATATSSSSSKFSIHHGYGYWKIPSYSFRNKNQKKSRPIRASVETAPFPLFQPSNIEESLSDGVPSMEIKAVKELQEECQQMLAQFPTTSKQDQKMLDSMQEPRKTLETAIKYRLHWKLFIEKVIKALDIYQDRILAQRS